MNRFGRTGAAIAAAAVIALASLAACDSEQTDSARLVVTYSTLKVIEKADSPAEQLERAERIRNIATEVLELSQGEAATIALLEAAVRDKIVAAALSPADTFLANELLRLVVAELQERVGTGVLDPEKRLKLAAVVQWVLDATALAG